MTAEQEAHRQDLLARARAASLKPVADHDAFQALYQELHALAEEHYEPAIPFFEEWVYNVDADWRESGLTLLGWHYLDHLKGNDALFTRMRYLLANDPDSYVRIAAASLLINAKEESDFPDGALLQALEEDPNIHVRRCALRSLLTHAEAKYSVIEETMRQVERREMAANSTTLKRIIEEQGLTVPTEEFSMLFRERHPR